MFERLKEKWQIENNLQLALILITFAVTGTTAAILRKFLMGWLGFAKDDMSPWAYYPISILLMFVFYQITLLINGTLLGQFKFFWAFEKKMLSRFGIKFDETK